MKLYVWLVILVGVIGCDRVPLPPTETAPSPQLRWDRIGAGCLPRLPTPLPKAEDELICRVIGEETLKLCYRRPDDTLYVEFVRQGIDWVLCDWDTSDN